MQFYRRSRRCDMSVKPRTDAAAACGSTPVPILGTYLISRITAAAICPVIVNHLLSPPPGGHSDLELLWLCGPVSLPATCTLPACCLSDRLWSRANHRSPQCVLESPSPRVRRGGKMVDSSRLLPRMQQQEEQGFLCPEEAVGRLAVPELRHTRGPLAGIGC